SQQPVSICLLNLQPDWGISQLYPPKSENDLLLEPGQELEIPLVVWLPSGYLEGTDVIKVFATTEATSFRWLELPPIDQPSVQTRGMRLTSNPIEELFTTTPRDADTLDLALRANQSFDWSTAQVEARIGTQKSPEDQVKELDEQTEQLFRQGNYDKAIEKATQ